MNWLILSSCTGQKLKTERGPIPAEKLYTGQQHLRLLRGISVLRKRGAKADFHILSAGHGLIGAKQKIEAYDETFQGMKRGELREKAKRLRIPVDFANLVRQKYDFNLILLGDDYLAACEIGDETQFTAPTLFLCGKAAAKRLPARPNLRAVVLTNVEAKRFSCGLVALKGEMAHRIAILGMGPQTLIDPDFDVLDACAKIQT